jgi:hypothetical protein
MLNSWFPCMRQSNSPEAILTLSGLPKAASKNFNQGLNILQGNCICLDVRLNLVLGITLKVTIHIAKFVLVVRKMTVLSC